MSEDFIIEEEESGGSNRAFIVLAGALFVLFLIGAACVGFLFVQGGGDDEVATELTQTVSAIETENANTLIQNERVTQTMIAQATIDALPTSTPVPTDTSTPAPTSTSSPTDTPAPTDTPVVNVDTGDGTGGGDDDGTDDGSGDGTGDGSGDATATATISLIVTDDGSSDGAMTATPITGAGAGSGDNGTLPQTGLSMLGIVIAGVVLLALFMGARRLRST